MTKYIIEFRWKRANGTMSQWMRSANLVITQPLAEFHYHDTYEFDTLQEAIREIHAQPDKFEYRATPVGTLEVDPLFSFTTMSTEGKEKTVAREYLFQLSLEEASFYAKKALRNYEGNRA